MLSYARFLSGFTALIFGLLIVVHEARSEFTAYRVKIVPTGSQTTRPVVLVCSGSTMCQGQLELLIDGRRQWVAVAAAYESGNIVVGFKAGRLYLFVGQSPYGYVPV